MGLSKLPNGHWLQEDIISYPMPEITVQKVTHLEDIQALSKDSSYEGVVYVYVERTLMEGYVGETKSSPYSRYVNTHKNSEWLQRMENPVIFAFFGTNKSWDTDSRRLIESYLVFDLPRHGLCLSNRAQTERPQIPNHLGLNRHEIDDIVDVIKMYIQFEIGYKQSSISQKDTSVNLLPETQPSILQDSLLVEPVRFKHNSTIVWGLMNPSGMVKVYKAAGIPSDIMVYQSDDEKSIRRKQEAHTNVLEISILQSDGTYAFDSEEGTPLNRPTASVIGFFGKNVSNQWKTISQEVWEQEVGYKIANLDFPSGV